jgi:hypothetical protein
MMKLSKIHERSPVVLFVMCPKQIHALSPNPIAPPISQRKDSMAQLGHFFDFSSTVL